MKVQLTKMRTIQINLLLVFLLSPQFLFANSVGKIDDEFFSAKLCQNETCSEFQTVNFKPDNGMPVTINDNSLTGEIWLSRSGWVTLSTDNDGVLNDGEGNLSGFAWGQVSSWVNFSPTNGGVTINENGEFTGWAWVSGIYGGWIKFDCTEVSTCVKTDWRPASTRVSSSAGGLEGPPLSNGFPGALSVSNNDGKFINSSSTVEEISLNTKEEDVGLSKFYKTVKANVSDAINEIFSEENNKNFSQSNSELKMENKAPLNSVEGINQENSRDRVNNSQDVFKDVNGKPFTILLIIFIILALIYFPYNLRNEKRHNVLK